MSTKLPWRRIANVVTKSLADGKVPDLKTVPEVQRSVQLVEGKVNRWKYDASKKMDEVLYGRKQVQASVPFMITRNMHEELSKLGYDKHTVSGMTPDVAWKAIDNKMSFADYLVVEKEKKLAESNGTACTRLENGIESGVTGGPDLADVAAEQQDVNVTVTQEIEEKQVADVVSAESEPRSGSPISSIVVVQEGVVGEEEGSHQAPPSRPPPAHGS